LNQILKGKKTKKQRGVTVVLRGVELDSCTHAQRSVNDKHLPSDAGESGW
jgi:hypothetical protein